MAVHPRRRRLVAVVGPSVLFGFSGCLGALVPDVDEEGDALVEELWIYDRGSDQGEPVADTHYGHWHGGLPDVPRGSVLSLDAEFRNHDREPIPIGDDEPNQLRTQRTGKAHETIAVDNRGDHVRIAGEKVGEAEIVFQLVERDERIWESPPITLAVSST